jgi:quercetin dioxygenase-like cupin family protein
MNHQESNCKSIFFIFTLLLSFTNLHAQIPVHQEPFHPPIFQNKQVRILNAKLPPGDTTQYHLHHTPSVFIFLTKTTMLSQLQGKDGSTSTSKAGSIIFEDLAAPNERVHRVINVDKDTLHVLDFELISNDTGFVEKPLIHLNLKLEIDNTWARAYRLTLANTNDIVFNERNYSYILVSLGKAIVRVEQHGKKEFKALKRGSFIEIKSKESFSIKNASSSTAEFALIELPQQ